MTRQEFYTGWWRGDCEAKTHAVYKKPAITGKKRGKRAPRKVVHYADLRQMDDAELKEMFGG